MEKRTILVTGGASGIGKAIAKRFIAAGDTVIILGTTPPDFEATFFETDVRREEDIATAVAQIDAIDVVVNSAGVYKFSPTEQTTKEELDTIMDTNFKGTFLIAKHTLPILKQSKGTLINIASILALVPEAESAVYCASKAAVVMLTKCLAIEYATRVRVNAVLPGPIDTPMLRSAFSSEEAMREYEKTVLMKRIGSVEDVANVVEFLASEKASYVTGALYTVDGGESISR